MKTRFWKILITMIFIFGLAVGLVCWSCHEHGGLPTMVRYSGYYIPVGFSINRMDDGFYVVALHWRSDTIAIERDGLHRYGG